MTVSTARAPQGAARPATRSAAKSKGAPKNNPGRPTLAELERRKGEIMRVATALFVKEGYSGTSLVDIAKSAGVATRTLYQHYGDKEALFNMVMFARETAAVLPPPEITDEDTLHSAMMKIAEYACDVTFRATTVDMMRLAISESQRFPQMMRKLMDRSQAHFNSNVRKVLDGLTERGLIEEGDTAEASELFMNLVLGNTPLLIFGGWKASLPTSEQLAQRVELFILGRWGPGASKRAHSPQPRRGRPKSPTTPEMSAAPPARAKPAKAKAAAKA